MVRPLGIIMPATKSVFKCKGGALPLLLPARSGREDAAFTRFL